MWKLSVHKPKLVNSLVHDAGGDIRIKHCIPLLRFQPAICSSIRINKQFTAKMAFTLLKAFRIARDAKGSQVIEGPIDATEMTFTCWREIILWLYNDINISAFPTALKALKWTLIKIKLFTKIILLMKTDT